jgi:hypothetical protein
MTLRDKVTEAMLDYAPIPVDRQGSNPFYYQDFRNNLYCPMENAAATAYGNGSGGETAPSVRNGKIYPPKMASVASSSAMTFNLLGNETARICPGTDLPHGKYEIGYEKQMYTLNLGSSPANLDVFLSNEADKTAIFCEMKLLEWLNPPGTLKASYFNPKYYFASDDTVVPAPVDAFTVFQKIIDQMKAADFHRYDAWQMFKHLLAIYNYTSFTTKETVEGFRNIPSLAGKYHRIILANVVNEFPPERIEDAKTKTEYISALEEEQKEAACFAELIRCSEISRLFESNCHADIEVKYMSAKGFAACLDMPQAKRNYLKRYFT